MAAKNPSSHSRKLINLTVSVTPNLISQIDALAQKEGEHNRSALMRRLLSEGLRRYAVLQAQEGK